MPLYEQECTKCTFKGLVRRPYDDTRPPPTCPQCGGVLKKLLSTFTIVMH